MSESLHLTKFSDIACEFLNESGFSAYECESEQEARDRVDELSAMGFWPCYFFESDTTGEKDFEEFFTRVDEVEWGRFSSIGVVRSFPEFEEQKLRYFEREMPTLLANRNWAKSNLLRLFYCVLPGFSHLEKGKYLNQRM